MVTGKTPSPSPANAVTKKASWNRVFNNIYISYNIQDIQDKIKNQSIYQEPGMSKFGQEKTINKCQHQYDIDVKIIQQKI